eukprot:3277069-Pyramimonas_sp.AAC.1
MWRSIYEQGGAACSMKLRGLPGDIKHFWSNMKEHVIYKSVRYNIDDEFSVPSQVMAMARPRTQRMGLFYNQLVKPPQQRINEISELHLH